MPSEEFPKMNIPEDMSERMGFDPSEEDVLNAVKKGEWIRYIVNENSKIFFTTGTHESLMRHQGIDRKDCLVDDALFKIRAGYLVFNNSGHGNILNKDERFLANVAKAIKKWLKAKGVEYK